jgi:uncharacterized membrane protein YqjE
MVALARLVAFAIDDHDRWMRFLALMLLVLAVVASWWLLADGGLQVLLHDFSEADVAGRIGSLALG